MAVLNQICASWADLNKQTAAFQAELQAIESGIRESVKQVLDNDTDVETSVDAALTEANAFFSQQNIGGLNQALVDSGIATPDTDSSKTLHDLGFYKSNGRYWKSNALIPATASQRNYGFVGIGSGDYTSDQIQELLGRVYEEPSAFELQEMLQTAHAATAQRQQTSRSDDSGSVTGSRSTPGNIANIRELYHACGSSLSVLSKFLDGSYALGFGCVWSTTRTTAVTKPVGMQAQDFNASYVRKQLSTVLFDADMDFAFDSRYCVVREEIYLGHNIPRADIQALANKYEDQMQLPANSLPLLARTVRFKPQEDSIGSSPLLVSRGCDASKLSGTAYHIGISVNGVYRVIDCTGDSGQRITRTTYTVQDIVDSVNEVFGDLVESGTIGTEFFIKLKPGFGSLGSISLFYVPGTDCSEAIGLQGCINESAQGRALVQERRLLVPDLATVKEVFWFGGANEPSQGTSSFYVSYASNLKEHQRLALQQQSNYWAGIAEQVTKHATAVYEAYQNKTDPTGPVRELEETLVFCDINNFNYREFKSIQSGFGAALHQLLVMDTAITSIDVYASNKTVRDSLSNTLNVLVSNDGLVNNTTAWISMSMPLDLNYSTAARARLLYAESTDLSYLNEALALQAAASLQAYAPSMASATNQVVSKTTSASTFSKILDGADALLDAVSDLIDSDMNRVIWNAIKDLPGVSELIAGEQYLEGKLNALADGIDSGVRAIQDLVQDLLSSLGLTSLDRKAVNILLQAQACLDSAQRIVNSIKTTYNKTTKKIVALSNFNVNFSGSLGFQTKYLSCYASGALNYQSTVSLAKMLQIISDAADALNKRLKQMVDMIDQAIDKLLCMLDTLTASLTGSMSYETTMQVGIVTMKANCVSSISLGSTFSPNVLSHIMDLRRQIDFLLASMKLQQVTFKKHDQNLKASASMFSATLQDTVDGILSKVTKCF